MHKQKKILPIILVLTLAAVSIGAMFLLRSNTGSNQELKDKPRVIVSILPQVQIVEKIAGDSVDVTVLIPPGFSPATYEPTVKDIKTVSQADIYFRIGHIPFEETNVLKFQEINSEMLLVDTSINNKLREIEAHDHEDHDDDHDEDNVEAHDSIDPHVWLSPKMVKQQAEIIRDTLIKMTPSNQELYEDNYQQLAIELDELDIKLVAAFAPIKGKTMLVYHPAFGYLADEYGFIQEHIEIEGKEPSVLELQRIINQAKQENIKVIFVQKQFSKDSAQSIAENIGGAVVQIDPMDPNYLSNIENLANIISSKMVK